MKIVCISVFDGVYSVPLKPELLKFYAHQNGNASPVPNLKKYINFKRGRGSSVGIATDYGLDGPGSNPGGDEIFRPFRPALGPTQHPVQCVSGLSRG